jgi:hypothetical protein
MDQHQYHMQHYQDAHPIQEQPARIGNLPPLEGVVFCVTPLLEPQAEKLTDGGVLQHHQVLVAPQSGLLDVGHRPDDETHFPVFLHIVDSLHWSLDGLLPTHALLADHLEVANQQRLEHSHVLVRRARPLNLDDVSHHDVAETHPLCLPLPVHMEFLRRDRFKPPLKLIHLPGLIDGY